MISRTGDLAYLKNGTRDDVVTVGPIASGPHFDSYGMTMSISNLTHIHNHSHTIPLPISGDDRVHGILRENVGIVKLFIIAKKR